MQEGKERVAGVREGERGGALKTGGGVLLLLVVLLLMLLLLLVSW